MKILIVSQYFWPENFKINEFAQELITLGHDVTVLTGKPNYPKGDFYQGYGFFSKAYEQYDGINIIRVPVFPRKKSKSINLALNYLSFVFFATIFLFFHQQKYSFSFIYAVSPVTVALPVVFNKRINCGLVILWVQDLWPESVLVTNRIKSKLLIRILHKMVSFIYAKCDKIFISSLLMKKSVLEKLPVNSKVDIAYMPNWAEDIFYNDKATKPFDVNIFTGFNILFAGNIGFGQDVESIIYCAKELLEFPEIKFIIVGDGSKKNLMEKMIRQYSLENKVLLLGSFPLSDMPSLYENADLLLVTLKDEKIYSYTLPSKVQSYMAASKPIVCMANGETAHIINHSKCGVAVSAGDYKQLALEILNLSKMSKEDLIQMGENGRQYSNENFNRETIIEQLLSIDELKNLK